MVPINAIASRKRFLEDRKPSIFVAQAVADPNFLGRFVQLPYPDDEGMPHAPSEYLRNRLIQHIHGVKE
ncbi:hypothetical protein, partial [Lysinibacillus sp. GbtcB16]|uniref:hypothetical protein n=1 Tax=Lysinibacillus sp. GbtcB16 TaxID=2824761 RepID=UPI001C3068D0